MKKIIKFLIVPAFVAAGILSSCHKLDVKVTSELTPESFPVTPAQYASVIGPVYTALRSDYAVSYWFLQSCSSDEAILPAYGANWYDGNKYQELHRHTWTKDNGWVNSVWSYLENIIGTTNQTIYIVKKSPDGPAKDASLAELKTMRALSYFYLMDSYGNVPLDTAYGTGELQTNTPRAQVFNFIESELKSAIPYLSTASGASTYGKPNRYTAFALLAKMYLNAEVYTGTAKYNECIAACDSVMNSGNYSLEPMSTYLKMFYPTNGPSMKEFIFAIPYDPSTSNGTMFYARYDLNRNLGIRYSYSGSTAGGNIDPIMNKTTGNGLSNNKPSGPRATLPEYYANFNDPNDIRDKQWLTGPQYWPDGNPIMVKTTKSGYDQFYTGSDGGAEYIYPLVIDPNIVLRANPALFDVGNDEIGWNMGTRNIKFYPDYTNTTSRNQSNDVPIFRYSDIMLMKAEAILRGGTATLGQTALSLVNMLRANRTTSAARTSVTLDDIYAERCREFAWETWHRNDMIRFGKFEDSYGFKNNADTYRRIFPIPTTALSTNPKLVQNPGY
ncbi:RagB/SusD family nutrient uptake outer membrane protein [Ginsengibacter hankyongi]|uniref:RagB/SusD family nutrient uptake outer membrane protein n=1 Tax=Ginsengibacter hankyongi TaxID=2607284 RepID=A0A5J5IK49_9BACT|nr:RagB/SusD family nutrient uptake outer membrane protein [Ginsengibacter hankyongi]KAA9041181.1 RagB/SusD family nutrient uptake outer membrane protein [Ginsengibacter hankyongi]